MGCFLRQRTWRRLPLQPLALPRRSIDRPAWRRLARRAVCAAWIVIVAAVGITARAESAPTLPAALPEETLDLRRLGKPGPHWLWVHDFGSASAARLFDADTGQMLGMLDTTFWTAALEWAPRRDEVMFVGSYYARGTRGARVDTVGIYSLGDLAPLAEIVLPAGPPQIAAGVPMRGYSGLLDGARFMAIYNFKLATSVSIVDLIDRQYIGEIDTSGCGLVFPASNVTFLQLCGDGTVQRIRLDLVGKEEKRDRSERFFDPHQDPLMEKAVRDGDLWWFVSFEGKVIGVSGQTLVPLEPFTVQGSERKDAGWRPGGFQPLALHRESHRLYVLMHEGGPDTHKDPGSQVWVFDLLERKRVARIELATPALSIDVSQDAAPLLYATNPVVAAVEVYDAYTGRKLRTIAETGAGIVLQALTGDP